MEGVEGAFKNNQLCIKVKYENSDHIMFFKGKIIL
ncbi:hypothetical protein BH10BAC5_BH10BAC5_07000 [soil metagenome]